MGKNTIMAILKKNNILWKILIHIRLFKCRVSCLLEFALKFSNNNGSTHYWFDCSNYCGSEIVTKGNTGFSLSHLVCVCVRVCVCMNISVIQCFKKVTHTQFYNSLVWEHKTIIKKNTEWTGDFTKACFIDNSVK